MLDIIHAGAVNRPGSLKRELWLSLINNRHPRRQTRPFRSVIVRSSDANCCNADENGAAWATGVIVNSGYSDIAQRFAFSTLTLGQTCRLYSSVTCWSPFMLLKRWAAAKSRYHFNGAGRAR